MNVIVEREKGLIELERRITELRAVNATQPVDMSAEIRALEQKYDEIQREIFGSLTPWEKVHMARHPNRPTSLDYIAQLRQFDELHGDRLERELQAAGFPVRDGVIDWPTRPGIGYDLPPDAIKRFGMAS